MKPLQVILICLITSAVTAVGLHFALRESQGTDLRTGADDALYNANERMAALEADLADSESRTAQLRRLLEQAQDVAAIQPGEIAKLREELSQLRERMAAGGGPAKAGRRMKVIGDDGEEYVASASELESFIAQQIEDRVETSAKKSRRNQFKQWAPFARMGMMRSLKKNAQKLGLNAEQTKRLEETATKSLETIMPRVGILMDSEATADERETALTEVRDEMETANSEAESYMTSEQYSEYQEMQSQQNQQFEQWLEALGGANNNNGANAPPPAGTDG